MSICERLEGRRLFSFTASSTDITLNVNVNGYAQVEETAPGTFVVSDAHHSQTFTYDLADGNFPFVTIQGGRGSDLIVFSGSSGDAAVNVNGGGGSDAIFVTDTLPGNTSPGGIIADGGDGSDYIEVRHGNLTQVLGENGNDVIVVDSGSANVSGGNGNDVLVVRGDGTTVTWDGGCGYDVELGTATT